MNTLDPAIGRLRAAVDRCKRVGFASIVLDASDATVILTALDLANQPPEEDGLPLTRIERSLYVALKANPGEPVTYEELRRRADTPGARPLTVGSMWVHIRRLRMKLEAAGMGEIQTVRGVGYQLKEGVSNGQNA